MDIIYQCVAGLDLHKETTVAAVRSISPAGRVETDLRTFGTMTRDLLELSEWLAGHGVTHVAMEATGVLWKPVWNLLDGRFALLLVNPRELKQVPGRKSDLKDAQWIAQLLQHGLLRSSFVPSRPQRELRDLTRHRAQLEGERTRTANRIHKLLEDANLKLGVVASDILGVSGAKSWTDSWRERRTLRSWRNPRTAACGRRSRSWNWPCKASFSRTIASCSSNCSAIWTISNSKSPQFTARIEELMVPFVDEGLQEKLDADPGR